MRRAAVGLFALLVAVSACAQGGDPPRLQWQKFVPDDESFVVRMPGVPRADAKTLTAKNNRPVVYRSYTVDLGKSAYMVTTSDYDEQTRISLDGAIDGVISTWEKPRILSRRATSFDGYPAITVQLESGIYRVEVRVFAVGRRLYQVGFVEERTSFDPSHVSDFMGSFRLL